MHCLLACSIIGETYESTHCWVNELLDSPAKYLGGGHRILLHDIETAKKIGQTCWWAGFAAALHIDIDNLPKPLKIHIDGIVTQLRNGTYFQKEVKIRNTSSLFRTAFRNVHEKMNVRIYLNEKTGAEELIIFDPDTPL